MMREKPRTDTRTLTLMAMLAAMAYVAMLVTRPLPQVAGFLSYDLKDVVVVIGGFILGPLPALLITVVVSLVEMITVSHTQFIGFAMNVLSTGAFALPAALVYGRWRRLRGAAAGLALGVVCMTLVMLAWNLILTPLYMHVSREAVTAMLLPTFLPFNLAKGGLNAGITMLIYKPVSGALRRAGLLPERAPGSPARTFSLPVTLLSVFVVVTCALVLFLKAR